MNANAERWLAFAQEDLKVAEVLFGQDFYNQTCFHAQQCVEKLLKALICEQNRVPPRTHALTDLLNLLPQAWFSDFQGEIENLDDYYIPTRYPDALPGVLPDGLPGKEQSAEALETARKVYISISHRLK